MSARERTREKEILAEAAKGSRSRVQAGSFSVSPAAAASISALAFYAPVPIALLAITRGIIDLFTLKGTGKCLWQRALRLNSYNIFFVC